MTAGLARFACALLVLTGGLGAFACDEKKGDKPKELPPALSAVASVIASTGPPIMSAAPVAAPPTSVAAQHVLVAYKGAKGADAKITRSKPDAKKRAEEVLAKAKAGTDFAALAAEYTDDPGSKTRQGSVGKFTHDKMVKPFADAAFALPVDGISDVVESESGFHVIKRNQ